MEALDTKRRLLESIYNTPAVAPRRGGGGGDAGSGPPLPPGRGKRPPEDDGHMGGLNKLLAMAALTGLGGVAVQGLLDDLSSTPEQAAGIAGVLAGSASGLALAKGRGRDFYGDIAFKRLKALEQEANLSRKPAPKQADVLRGVLQEHFVPAIGAGSIAGSVAGYQLASLIQQEIFRRDIEAVAPGALVPRQGAQLLTQFVPLP